MNNSLVQLQKWNQKIYIWKCSFLRISITNKYLLYMYKYNANESRFTSTYTQKNMNSVKQRHFMRHQLIYIRFESNKKKIKLFSECTHLLPWQFSSIFLNNLCYEYDVLEFYPIIFGIYFDSFDPEERTSDHILILYYYIFIIMVAAITSVSHPLVFSLGEHQVQPDWYQCTSLQNFNYIHLYTSS